MQKRLRKFFLVNLSHKCNNKRWGRIGDYVEEFKSLEIDIEKGIYKLNGKDLTKCQEIAITIKPEKADVYVVTTTDKIYKTLDIKERKE